MKIIDSHVHIGPEPLLKSVQSFDDYQKIKDECGIDEVIYFGSSESRNPPFTLEENWYPFYWVYMKGVPPNELHPEYKGIKLHPGIDNTICSLSKIAEFVGRMGLPVLVHCGRHSLSHWGFAILLAEKFPDINFILSHLGSPLQTASIEMFTRHWRDAILPNVYFDTASTKCLPQLQRAVETVGSEKIIFGSDSPWMHPKLSIELVNLLDISENDKELIFHKNIEGLIK